jgi:hypothetical protein
LLRAAPNYNQKNTAEPSIIHRLGAHASRVRAQAMASTLLAKFSASKPARPARDKLSRV